MRKPTLKLWEPKPEWHSDAKCRDLPPSFFFPEDGGDTSAESAKDVCWGRDGKGECPVRQECLEYALSHNEIFGIWGGESERQRRPIRRQRREAAVSGKGTVKGGSTDKAPKSSAKAKQRQRAS